MNFNYILAAVLIVVLNLNIANCQNSSDFHTGNSNRKKKRLKIIILNLILFI